MRSAVLLVAFACTSAEGPNKDRATPTDTGSVVDPGSEVCPGWSPVIAFGGFSTPAGEGLASVISEGWGWIVPPPRGGCYAGCTASTTIDDDGYPVAYTYSWNAAGELVDGAIDYGDGDPAHMTLSYNASGQVSNFTEGTLQRTEFRYDADGELLGWHRWEDIGGDEHEVWVDYANTVAADELVAARAEYSESWNDSNPFFVLAHSYAWMGGRVVEGSSVSEATQDGCVPESSVEVEYDERGLRTRESRSDDECDDPPWTAETTYNYDENGRLIEVEYEQSGGASLTYTYQLTYDAHGRALGHTIGSDYGAFEYRYNCPN